MSRDWPRALAVAFAVLLVFAPVLSNDWVSWDDPEAIVENDALRDPGVVSWAFTTSHMSHFQPLSWLLWASTGRLFGFTPEVFHGLSLLFHIVNSVLLFFLMGELGIGRNGSAIAALLYGIHPLRVEPVAWASAFPYLLATGFVLAATLFYLRRRLAASTLLYAASVLARPTAFAFPLVLLTLDVVRKRRPLSRLLVEKAPFFALALAGLLVGHVALWVNDCDCWPAAYAVRLPDCHAPVDYYGVADFVPADGFPYVLCFLLVVEFRRVHSNDNHRPAMVFFLYPLQVRQRVHTVDATVRPEIKNDHVAF